MSLRFRVLGFGFRVWGLGFRVEGLAFQGGRGFNKASRNPLKLVMKLPAAYPLNPDRKP